MKAKTLHSLAIKHLAKYLTLLNSTRYQAKRSYEKLKKINPSCKQMAISVQIADRGVTPCQPIKGEKI